MHSSHPHTTFTFTCSSKSQQFLCCQRKEDKITKNYDLKIVTADHNQNNLTKSTQSDKKKKKDCLFLSCSNSIHLLFLYPLAIKNLARFCRRYGN